MSLRVIKPSSAAPSLAEADLEGLQPPGAAAAAPAPAATATAPDDGDEWGTRIAKLIPAEALGLFGSAVALVPSTPYRLTALWVIVVICMIVTILVRYRATQAGAGGNAQYVAIGISLVSFLIWLLALPAAVPEISPLALPVGLAFVGPLLALLWGTLVPYFYRGD